MNGRRETGLLLSVSEMLNVSFLSRIECIGEGACKRDRREVNVLKRLRVRCAVDLVVIYNRQYY